MSQSVKKKKKKKTSSFVSYCLFLNYQEVSASNG